MPWRLEDETSYHRYAIICPECQQRRGWPNVKRAQRHLDDLTAFDFGTESLRAVEYSAGDDETCRGH